MRETMSPSTKINKALESLDAVSRLSATRCPPMERRIEQSLAQFELLRASGLTWRQIVLGLPSWRQKDGTPVSEDQIRGAFSRVRRKRKSAVLPRPVAASEVRAPPQRIVGKPVSVPLHTQPTSKSLLMAQLDLTRKLRQT